MVWPLAKSRNGHFICVLMTDISAFYYLVGSAGRNVMNFITNNDNLFQSHEHA